MKSLELTGKRFGRLTAIQRVGKQGKKFMWDCVCECGKSVSVRVDHLTSGRTRSCGCILSDWIRETKTVHGKTGTRVYRIWRDMINRCHYERYHERHLYGGRGIIVCERWRNSFEAFLEDMGEPEPNLTIDRIDTNGNYEPGNCRWATMKEQNNNRRNNKTRIECHAVQELGVEFAAI